LGGISDHSPTVITVGTLKSFGPKPFKFYNFWMEHKGFLDWVKEGWNTYVEGAPMYKLYIKLRSVKAVLKENNMVYFLNLKQRVNQARDNLTLAQKPVLANFGSADNLLKEKECLHAYVSITKVEESFLKQKARNQWLQLGDQNNSFFHIALKVKSATRSITYLWDENGAKVDDVEQIKKVTLDFYKNLLETDQLHFNAAKADWIRQLIHVAIFPDLVVNLERDVSVEEIKDTLFHMHANKAPGPNGFHANFFRSSWSIVDKEVIAAIQSFFFLLVPC
jgi:hypothetical protein